MDELVAWPEDQIAQATGPLDTRPGFLKNLAYCRTQLGQSQFYYRFIYHCARDLRPGCYVELGVLDGWGVLHAKVGNSQAHVIGVDQEVGSYRLDRFADLFPVTLLDGDSIAMATVFEERFGPIVEMMMFDSDHHAEYMVEEFEAWDRLCVPGAIQMFDDVLSRTLRLGWDAIPGPKRLVPALHRETGFGIRIKP